MAKQNAAAARQARDNETAMRADQRFDYSAIVDRERLKLPRGVRMIVWPVVNVEEWDITRPMPRQYSNPPGGQTMVPDVQNWGWHEYGMRVGIWRIIESLRRHRIKPTMSINARMDDQPFYVKTRHGPIVSIPYSVELNDILIMLSLQQESGAMLRRVRDAFDQMYRESAKRARVLAFGVHPYISGAAHRIKYFDAMLAYMKKRRDVVFWQGDQICDWFTRAVPK